VRSLGSACTRSQTGGCSRSPDWLPWRPWAAFTSGFRSRPGAGRLALAAIVLLVAGLSGWFYVQQGLAPGVPAFAFTLVGHDPIERLVHRPSLKLVLDGSRPPWWG
jgi:hypothetical protein